MARNVPPQGPHLVTRDVVRVDQPFFDALAINDLAISAEG
jgi:hypothetical protein